MGTATGRRPFLDSTPRVDVIRDPSMDAYKPLASILGPEPAPYPCAKLARRPAGKTEQAWFPFT